MCILKCNNCIMMYKHEKDSSHVLCNVIVHVPLYRGPPVNKVSAQRTKERIEFDTLGMHSIKDQTVVTTILFWVFIFSQEAAI